MLIVEDSAPLRRSLARAQSERFEHVHGVGTIAEARAALENGAPDLLLLDFARPDGDAIDLLTAMDTQEPMPICIAMSGEVSPDEFFALAQLGVRSFVPKPMTLEKLDAALDEALNSAPDLTPHVRAMTGYRSIPEVEEEVRSTMVGEALARSGGNRRAAARILQISRQMLQHILRR